MCPNSKLLALSVIILTLSACLSGEANESIEVAKTEDEQSTSSSDQKSENEASMHLTGTIEYQSFEGGFYGFISKDGKKYTLHKLAPEHRRHGLVVKLSAEPIPDMATTTQFGELIRVVEMEVLDDSKVKPILRNDVM